jgi:hypothetical protein
MACKLRKKALFGFACKIDLPSFIKKGASHMMSKLGNICKIFLVAMGAVVAAPVILPVFSAAFKPALKLMIRGGVGVFSKGNEMVTRAREHIEDAVAEVRMEGRDRAAKSQPAEPPPA